MKTNRGNVGIVALDANSCCAIFWIVMNICSEM